MTLLQRRAEFDPQQGCAESSYACDLPKPAWEKLCLFMSSLSRVLGDIQQLFAAHGNATTNVWYILTDIPEVYRLAVKSIDASSKSEEQKLMDKEQIVMRLREGLLKTFIASGFPKTINALQHLSSVTPDEIRTRLPNTPIRKEQTWEDVQDQRNRGRTLFGKIYERHTHRILANMHTSHPDLAQAALHQLYGPILSETSVISARETSLVVVAGLMAQDLPGQLRGHVYGALHNGSTKDEVKRVEKLVALLSRHYQTESKEPAKL
ncbi:hypothetical protein DFQ29_001647 [Apophysomyces sp. BC1021]|nr:hypothetical protein DFQ29_001647 [Apophysomyces sp. BC1021]